MPDTNTPAARPTVPFTIAFGETVRLGDANTSIRFEALIQDGRCPVNGACLWEGVAEVQFALAAEGGEETDFILSIPGLVETPYTDNAFVEQAGFRFKLLQLEPYPTDDSTAQPDAYQARLVFE